MGKYKEKIFVIHIPMRSVYDAFIYKNRNLDLIVK